MINSQLLLAWQMIPVEFFHTLYMVIASTLFALIIGLPLGIILTLTAKGHLKEQPTIHRLLSLLVNTTRSVPFAILMILLIPFTRLLIGTSLGTTASIVPLTIAAIPFAARLIESALKEVNSGLIEAALIMGSSPWQIVYKVMFPEALPALILGVTTLMINLIGYSAMAGTMGGGGLGKVAIQYGYQRFNPILMAITVILLIFLVQLIQAVGSWYFNKIIKQRSKGTFS